jgi:hypothetical protein
MVSVNRKFIADREGGVALHHRLASIKRDEQTARRNPPASGRRWQQRWSPALLIPRPFDRDETLSLDWARASSGESDVDFRQFYVALS